MKPPPEWGEFYREDAKNAKKSIDSDFMDQGNGSTELAEVRVAVIYADAVGSLQKTFAPFAPSRFVFFSVRPVFLLAGLVRASEMNIDCYMSEGCGSYHQLRENIDKALSELSVLADVGYHTVSYDEAIRLGLKGSPTIRINGKYLDEGGSPGIL